MCRGCFYVVCVMKLYIKFVLSKWYNLVCNFWDREGEKQQIKLHPKLYRLAYLCAVVTNKVETVICQKPMPISALLIPGGTTCLALLV